MNNEKWLPVNNFSHKPKEYQSCVFFTKKESKFRCQKTLNFDKLCDFFFKVCDATKFKYATHQPGRAMKLMAIDKIICPADGGGIKTESQWIIF